VSDLNFVPDAAGPVFRFESAPVHNMLCSLCILNQDHLDHISPWVDEVLEKISAEEKADAEIACGAVIHVGWTGAKTIPEFIDVLSAAPAERMVNAELDNVLDRAARYLHLDSLPSREELLQDRETYVGLVQQLVEQKEPEMFNREMVEREYGRLASPETYKQRLTTALRHFYERYLQPAWQQVGRTIDESVAAFRSVEVPRGSLEDRLKFVTGRDFIPPMWLETLEEAKTIVYVPSVHIGPYMILFDFDGTTAYLVGRARVPEGAKVHSASLDRSDLLIKLDALSDATRMRILELSAERGEITSQDVIDELDLSQSSASRHLSQLAATGLITVDSTERTKKYRINPRRIDDVCTGLKHLIAAAARV
jgi:DNA-binding transcriptional ArsR family regulator